MSVKIGFANQSAESCTRLSKTRLLKSSRTYEQLHTMKLAASLFLLFQQWLLPRSSLLYSTNCRFLGGDRPSG
ncbi:hypothetical protein QUB63_22850 [Microcoleus sp. ARI1-B5]|uniref:hypothetical protein n=1 Tax=Microcoleus sp. ARI1-B5 TaxID=2818563 RepID=UPI002FCF8B32